MGNRLSEVSSLGDVSSGSWTFNPDDEVASETYDANGNVTSTGGKSFTYDSENHMMTMSSNGTAVSMVYDAFGNRVSKTVNGVTTQYLVEDDKNPTGYPQVFDELTNGAVTRTYTYGLQRIDEEQVIDGSWTPSFYGYDGGGNVRQLTNAAGAVTDSYEYDAFGNEFTVSGTTPNNYLYRGEQYDPDLGLYYLRARYYNPSTGRFMGRDPDDGYQLDPKSLHRYLYAGGDPINRVDPSGRAELLQFVFTTADISTPAEAGLTAFAGGTAAAVDATAAAIEAGLDTITELLTEELEALSEGAYKWATELLEDAIKVYDDLLVEASFRGGVVRYFFCEGLGLTAELIADHAFNLPKGGGVLVNLAVAGTCAPSLELMIRH